MDCSAAFSPGPEMRIDDIPFPVSGSVPEIYVNAVPESPAPHNGERPLSHGVDHTPKNMKPPNGPLKLPPPEY